MENKITWIQCDNCNKWRSIPSDYNVPKDDETWYCEMNNWNSYNSCLKEVEQEYESEEDVYSSDDDYSKINESDISDVDSDLSGFIVDDDDIKDTFVPSSCKCDICNNINSAVRNWDTFVPETHVQKRIQNIANRIESEVITKEENKAFSKGISVNYHKAC